MAQAWSRDEARALGMLVAVTAAEDPARAAVLSPHGDRSFTELNASANRLLNDQLSGEESTKEPADGIMTNGKVWKAYDNLIPGVVDWPAP